MSAPAPVLVRLKTAAGMFGVGYDLLLKAVKEGDLPAIQPQQAFLVEPDAVLAYLRDLDAAKSP